MIATAILILAAASQTFLAVQSRLVVGDEAATLKAICEDKPIDSITVSQVSSLAAQLNQGGVECPKPIVSAITDLAKIISETSENACTEKSANAITQFYNDHLRYKDAPKALVNFALSYALRMSKRCKENMIEVLLGDATNQLDKDFDALAEYTAEIDVLLNGIVESGSMVSPSDLAVVLPNHNEIFHKLAIDSVTGPDVQRIKAICSKRFKPIYGQAVEPVTLLERAGFEHPESAIEGELSLSEEQVKKLNNWARVVFLCETMDLVETFKRPANQTGPDSVMFIDKESEEKLKEKLVGSDNEAEGLEQIDQLPNKRVSIGDVEPIPADQVDQLINLLEDSLALRLREKLSEKALSMAAKYMTCGDGIESLMACLQPQSNDVEPSSAARDRQVCGRPKSFCGMLLKIFFAGIFALMMMMIAGGG